MAHGHALGAATDSRLRAFRTFADPRSDAGKLTGWVQVV